MSRNSRYLKRQFFGVIGFLMLMSFSGAAQPDSGTRVSYEPLSRSVATSERPENKSGNGILVTRVGVQAAATIPLTLDDAIRRALNNNNNIEIARDDVRIQETQIRSLLGFYEPSFNVTPTFTRNSTTGSSATHDFSLNSNVTNFIRPGGGNYQVFFNNTRTENAFAQAQVTSGSLNTGGTAAIYSSSYGVRYTQPLLRNFSIDNTRRNLRIARRQLQQSDADFRRQTIEVIANVQRTYWDLVFSLRDQQNRLANLSLSQENLRQVEARIAAGAAAPLARAEVATELANRESDLLIATQQVSITENFLKQLLLKDVTSAEWSQTFVPVDIPAVSLDTVNMDAAVKDAMDNRFELRRLKLARDINAIDIDYFRNQAKPQIDLNTTLTFAGLSRGSVTTDPFTVPLIGSDPASISTNASAFLLSQIRRFHTGPNDTIVVPNVTIPGSPSYFVGGFGRSLANTFRSDAPNFSIGVTISFPFRSKTAKANLAGSRIVQNQIDTQIRAQEQVVIAEVRNAVQAVETARQRVMTSRRARENAEIQLEGEKQLYDAGRSTTFLLFQRENALASARNAEIRAETDYNKAIADLQRVTSTTFERNNIVVETPVDDQ
ncbi:MAG TPA: TolC family protein [Pyrinomonadaceae bacterium]|nr:TolC family protein [Pyrinomonadaceae bacterium]